MADTEMTRHKTKQRAPPVFDSGELQSLRLRVIAEGVETREQLNFLQTQGCGEGQGLYFSRPVTADQFAEIAKCASTSKVSPWAPTDASAGMKVVAPKRPSHPSRVGRLIVERFRPEMGQSPGRARRFRSGLLRDASHVFVPPLMDLLCHAARYRVSYDRRRLLPSQPIARITPTRQGQGNPSGSAP